MGIAMLLVGDAKAVADISSSERVDRSCATTAVGMACPTLDGGSIFKGCLIEPVISVEGRPTALDSELERDVQPDKARETETTAAKTNERMTTCTLDNRRDDGCTTASPSSIGIRLTKKTKCDVYEGSIR